MFAGYLPVSVGILIASGSVMTSDYFSLKYISANNI